MHIFLFNNTLTSSFFYLFDTPKFPGNGSAMLESLDFIADLYHQHFLLYDALFESRVTYWQIKLL